MKNVYVKLKDRTTVFQETEQRKVISGSKVMKAKPSARITKALRGGILVEATEAEIKKYDEEHPEPKKPQKKEVPASGGGSSESKDSKK